MFDIKIKKELKKLKKHLRSRSDEKLINGYKLAVEDRNSLAMALIKKEIDRRGLKIE